MKKLNWILELILTIVTCGLYGIYFFYKADANTRKLNEKPTKIIINYWVAFLITFFTGGIAMVIWFYQIFTAMGEEAKKLGVEQFYGPLVSTAIMLVPFYGFYYLCEYQNALAQAKGIVKEN